MDITRFFKLLKRYSWILILLPVIAAVITYSLSKNLPKEYKSDVQISTGLVDQSKQLTSQSQNDYFKTALQFSNIIERMKMRKISSILSYNLIIHDLENPQTAFRKYSPKIDSLSAAQKAEVIQLYKQKLIAKAPITVYDNKGKYRLYDILGSMGYDEASFAKKMNISRPDNSDFVNIEFVSENPLLSAYVVNTLATEFITNFTQDVYANQNTSIALLDSLLKKKELEMNSKNSALKEFKMRNGILNLDAQSAGVYAQISQYEERKAGAIRDIQANLGAINAIDSKLRGTGGDTKVNLNATSVIDNTAILNIKNQLRVANDRYIDGNFKPSDKKKIDSLQVVLNAQSSKAMENGGGTIGGTGGITVRQSLLQQKTSLEISTEQIKNTIASIDRQLATLKGQYSSMVPYDASIQNYTRDAEAATKDYMAAVDRTNQGRNEQNTGIKLGIAQIGLPGAEQPSKSMIYVVMAGAATFMLCFVGLVILFLLDRSIYGPSQLSKIVGSPVVGTLNFVKGDVKEPRAIWKDDGGNQNFNTYKDLLRSLRFELDKELTDSSAQILGITSLNNGAGKSFLSSSLIYAFAMTGKKVLLISGEQEASEKPISQKLIPSEFFETFLVKKEIQTEDLITVFNSKAHNSSLLETQSAQNLTIGFNVLKKEFDFIVIDVNSLVEINKAKEWLSFTDKSIAVFEYGSEIHESDKTLIAYIKNHPGFVGWVLNKVKEKAVS
jgi:succinoglycan biosynthesis transport protein ExoP